MNGATFTTRLPGTRTIYELVRRTGRLLRLSWVATGLGITVAVFLAVLLLACAVDLVAPLGTVLRVVAFLAVVGGGVAVYVWGVLRPIVRPLAPTQVARRIESHLPKIRNRLVSCVDLMCDAAALTHSAAFCRRLVEETNDRITGFPPRRVLDLVRLRWAAGVAIAMMLLLTAGLSLLQDRLPIALKRVLAPLADIPPAATIQYNVWPGSTTLLRGDDLPFVVRVDHGRPERLTLEIDSASGGKTLRYDLQESRPHTWTFTLLGFPHSFHYRVVGAGTWSPRYYVRLVDRPTITSFHTVLHPPAYLGLTEPRRGEPQVADVTGPEGSEVEVVAKVDGQVVEGQIQRLAAGTNAAPSGATAGATPAAAAALEPPVVGRLPMLPTAPGIWSGKFLLTSNGWYRIEFRNELGHANKKMTPGHFVGVPDRPPQINLERPGTDVVLAPGAKLPLVVAASDDFGLSTVRVAVVSGPTNTVTEVAPKAYPPGAVNDTIVTTIDLAPLGAKVGDVVRYRAEAWDRKGQLVQTREYVVRVATDADSADRRLARFTKDQDFFAQQLVDLITTQEVVRARLDGLAVRYAPLLETIEVARAEFRGPPVMAVPGELVPLTNSTANLPEYKLDPISANLLLGLEKRLGELAALQRQNAALAAQYFTALSNATAQAGALPVMPVQMTDQLRLLAQTFNQMVLDPMQGLAAALQQAAAAGAMPPDLAALQTLSNQLQQDLAAMRLSAQESAAASGLLGDKPEEALARIEEARLRHQARLMGHELQGLHDDLGNLLDEMRQLQTQQETLVQQTLSTPETNLPRVVQQQGQIDEELAPVLDLVQQILDQQRLRRLRRPQFPAQPYAPDSEEYLVPAAEEDPAESGTATNQTAGADAQKKTLKDELEERLKKMDEEEEPLYSPALGGPQPKPDPRFADKRRPAAQPPADGLSNPEDRDELARQQWQRLQELDLARQSVQSDQASVAGLLKQLLKQRDRPENNQPNNQPNGQPTAAESAAQLADTMRSQAMQQAMTMASRLEQQRARMAAAQGKAQARMPGSPGGNPGNWYNTGMHADQGTPPEMDVNARTVILNMQPQLREELLQGMQEEGPEPYRKFIQNYFNQLTKVKAP